MQTTQPFTRKVSYGVSLLFLAGLWLPIATTRFSEDAADSLTEKRTLAPPPEWPPRKASELFAEIDAFYEDHFGGRAALIRAQRILALEGLGVAPTADVALGKDGWLFINVRHGFEAAAASDPFTVQELRSWQTALEQLQEYLENQECRLLFVVAPSKASVYPEYLPERIRSVRGESRLDQLVAHLRDNSDVAIIGLLPALRRAKSEEKVYSLTDTHWNMRGAAVASGQIAEKLQDWFPDLPPSPSFQFDTVKDGLSGDLTDLMGLPGHFVEDRIDVHQLDGRRPVLADIGWTEQTGVVLNYPPLATELPSQSLPRALMFHDSFGNSLRPFLSVYFQRAVYAWPRPMGVSRQLVERERPDVVILLMAERKLYGALPELL